VLGFGAGVRVVSPKSLADAIADEHRRASQEGGPSGPPITPRD
jgi:predicted DNA-binding transcriptional regulator YafY